MPGKELLVDLATIDFNQIVADIEEIRRVNPQRHEMEQLTAVVLTDLETKTCVGYKDITHNEFWCRGHMPGMPVMPGVIMLEAAAQLASYFVQKANLVGAKMLGFGGLEDVRFRGPVIPGDRLVLLLRLTRVRYGQMIVADFQGVVRNTLVVDGVIKGIPLPVEMLTGAASSGTS